jgi:hypothetical protein
VCVAYYIKKIRAQQYSELLAGENPTLWITPDSSLYYYYTNGVEVQIGLSVSRKLVAVKMCLSMKLKG